MGMLKEKFGRLSSKEFLIFVSVVIIGLVMVAVGQ